jgi:hypothetical protein
MTRSFHYTTPYDAIVQDEDGELSLLNTSAHCDVTPALPPEQAESLYKIPRSPRAEAEVQTQGQGHFMYSSAAAENRAAAASAVCVPTSSATANGFGPAALQLD